jgi:protein tyrosine/serine phosphatase
MGVNSAMSLCDRDVSFAGLKTFKSSKGTILFFCALFLLGLLSFDVVQTAAASSFPKEARLSERIFGLKGLSNVGRVTPYLYRGAQPRPEGYATLKKMGVKTVINLRTTSSEKKLVEAAGMKSVEAPMSVFRDVNVKSVEAIIDIINNPAYQPVFIHCKQGQDRTGVVVAVYRMKVDGWSFQDAEAEMQSFGFDDIWIELKEFIKAYARELGK